MDNLSGTYLDADFGFWEVAPASIGDEVFIDENGNGLYDPGEQRVPFITINLYLDGVLVDTTETSAQGTYLFGNLGPGNYTVRVDGNDPSLPTGYFPTISEYSVTLAAAQVVLYADFPLGTALTKTVSAEYAEVGETITFTLKPYFPGSDLLENARVIDPLPEGTAYVTGSANAGGVYGAYSSIPGETGTDY